MYSLELGLGCNFKFSIKLINCEVYLQQKYAHIIMYEEKWIFFAMLCQKYFVV